MSATLAGDAVYDETEQHYILTPANARKQGSIIFTGDVPSENYTSAFEVWFDTPTMGAGSSQMAFFISQIDADTSIEVGIHHNNASKQLTLSISSNVDVSNATVDFSTHYMTPLTSPRLLIMKRRLPWHSITRMAIMR